MKGNRDHYVTSKSMMLGVLLTIEFPPEYPNQAAQFTVRKASDMYLSEDELLLIDDLFRESLESNLGEPQIFEATERVREFLQNINTELVRKASEERSNDPEKKGVIPKYGTYTKISEEIFAAFEKKQIEALKKVRKEKKAGERPSGRQLFESKTAKETKELEEDEEVI